MAADFYQLRIQGLHAFEYNECVLYFKGDNLSAADYWANAKDLVDSFEGAPFIDWLNLFPTTYQVLRLSAMKASAGGGGTYSKQFQMGAQPGIISGAAASQQLCPVIRLIPPMGIKTAGKIFLPCIAESQVASNVVSSTWIANVAALFTAMTTPFSISAITWQLVIYSRKNGTFALAVDHDTSPIIGFQRRRQRAFY